MNRMRKTAEPISSSRTWFEHSVSRSRVSWDRFSFCSWSGSRSWYWNRFWYFE
jgi:hypothetical protein